MTSVNEPQTVEWWLDAGLSVSQLSAFGML